MGVLEKAVAFAAGVHAGSKRKGTNIPYILHPMETAVIASTMTDDEEVIAAAVLHDVVEDTETMIEEVEELFGKRIASIVAAESENKRYGLPPENTWKIRKVEAIEHFKNADKDSLIVALSDKLSNMRSMYRDYEKEGDGIWNKFNMKDKNEQFWYYSEIAKATESLSGFEAWKEYSKLIALVFTPQN